jgi:2-oxoglutarate dehydrogenase E1 component
MRATSRASPSRSCIPRSASTRRFPTLRRPLARGVSSGADWIDRRVASSPTARSEVRGGQDLPAQQGDWFEAAGSGLGRPTPGDGAPQRPTGVGERRSGVGETLTTFRRPPVHKTLRASSMPSADVRQRRRLRLGDGRALASAACAGGQRPPSGQDSGRGTFSQQATRGGSIRTAGPKYIPLCNLPGGRFRGSGLALSEFGVLGCEYGLCDRDRARSCCGSAVRRLRQRPPR